MAALKRRPAKTGRNRDFVGYCGAESMTKRFDQFWAELHSQLDSPVHVSNWTAAGRTGQQRKFKAWSGSGSFALRLSSHGNVGPVPGAIYCQTLTGESLRLLRKTEAQEVFNAWGEYTSGKVLRKELRERSKNLTYLIAILHHFEELMENR